MRIVKELPSELRTVDLESIGAVVNPEIILLFWNHSWNSYSCFLDLFSMLCNLNRNKDDVTVVFSQMPLKSAIYVLYLNEEYAREVRLLCS